jgi:cytochrome c551/c552
MGPIFRRLPWKILPAIALAFAFAVWAGGTWSDAIAANAARASAKPDRTHTDPAFRSAAELIDEGRYTFRYETFGDEAYWGDTLQLHRAIAGEANGGVGPGLTLEKAFELGLKIDAEALPAELKTRFAQGRVEAKSSKLMLELLELDAVVGLTGFFSMDRKLVSVGVQCAMCHSTVDDAVGTSVGTRLDGWANRDLDVGAFLAMSPNIGPLATQLGADDEAARAWIRAWGPGKVDAALVLDGAKRDLNQRPVPTLIPPAFGRAGLLSQQRHGSGIFYDPRAKDAVKAAMAADAGFSKERFAPDLVTPRLAALQVYQLVLRAPTPLPSTYNAASANRGKVLFEGRAKCAGCHVPPLFTEPDRVFHTASELGLGTADYRVRTAPLGGLFTHLKGGFYSDGRFPSVESVVSHYNVHFRLNLTATEQSDLVAYLKSL